MKLMIIRDPIGSFGSGHVSLIAWDDESMKNSSATNTNKNEIKAIHLDFYGADYTAKDVLRIKRLKSLPSLIENDNQVILDSKVSFDEFCKEINGSDYKLGYSFNIYSNNCVHSVLYALNVAGIKLELNNERSCKYLFCCFFAYTNIIKPVELIEAAREYKNNINEETPLLSQSKENFVK